MQYVRSASKSFVANKSPALSPAHVSSSVALNDTCVQSLPVSNVVRLFSSRELGARFGCHPAEVENELEQRGLSYHKNSGGLLWEVRALS